MLATDDFLSSFFFSSHVSYVKRNAVFAAVSVSEQEGEVMLLTRVLPRQRPVLTEAELRG